MTKAKDQGFCASLRNAMLFLESGHIPTAAKSTAAGIVSCVN